MWADKDDVLAVTGLGATPEEVAAGNAVISIYANRTYSASGSMGARDLEWLRQAVCWQTVWQRDQPGFEARSVASSYSQDGVSVSHSAEWNHTLAPLAARSMKNLSWKTSRTVRTPSVRVPVGFGDALDFGSERSDWYTDWES